MGTREELKMLQALPLEVKVKKTKQRIQEWIDYYGLGNVYVSVSGGKDSQVLLHIAKQVDPNITGLFINTGLEFNSVRRKGEELADIVIRPEMMFVDVLKTYGYPVISKQVSQCVEEARLGLKHGDGRYQYRIDAFNGTLLDKNGNKSSYQYQKYKPLLYAPFRISHKCCNIMKKRPAHKFSTQTGKKGIIGAMATESVLRSQRWVKYGCNAFEARYPSSHPLSFWTEQDILEYAERNELELAEVYGEIKHYNDVYSLTGEKRTGCTFCLFGAHIDGRMARLREIDKNKYDFVMRGGEFDNEGLWIPNKEGLGLKFVIDWMNDNLDILINY